VKPNPTQLDSTDFNSNSNSDSGFYFSFNLDSGLWTTGGSFALPFAAIVISLITKWGLGIGGRGSDMKARHETKPNESNETTSEQVNKSKHTGLCVHTTFPAPKSGAVEGRNGI